MNYIVRRKIKYKPINPQISFLSIVLKLAVHVQCAMSSPLTESTAKTTLTFLPPITSRIDRCVLQAIAFAFTFPRRRMSSTTTTVPTNKPRSDQLKIENWLNNNFLSGKKYMYDTVNIWRSVAVATGLFRFHSNSIRIEWNKVKSSNRPTSQRPSPKSILFYYTLHKSLFFSVISVDKVD